MQERKRSKSYDSQKRSPDSFDGNTIGRTQNFEHFCRVQIFYIYNGFQNNRHNLHCTPMFYFQQCRSYWIESRVIGQMFLRSHPMMKIKAHLTLLARWALNRVCLWIKNILTTGLVITPGRKSPNSLGFNLVVVKNSS